MPPKATMNICIADYSDFLIFCNISYFFFIYTFLSECIAVGMQCSIFIGLIFHFHFQNEMNLKKTICKMVACVPNSFTFACQIQTIHFNKTVFFLVINVKITENYLYSFHLYIVFSYHFCFVFSLAQSNHIPFHRRV